MFSDGGNFCPEEIDDFRKKLEKMSTKIDSAEGFVMADLEGMESKRLDQAMKISNEFEDRCVRCSLAGVGEVREQTPDGSKQLLRVVFFYMM